MAPASTRTAPARTMLPADVLFLSPDTIATTCGLSAEDLALLAGLPGDCAEFEPWHPRLQALLRDLLELFMRTRDAQPHDPGAPFWAAHRAVRALGGRTLVEAVADGDWAAVDAHLQAAR